MPAYKSQYQTLIVSGCSFTANNHESSCCWANVLADHTGMNIINLAVDAAGNRHIANSIILYLTQQQLDPAGVLVLPMWSGISRTDFIIGQHYTLHPVPVRKFNYDSFTQLYSICEATEQIYYGPWAAAYKKMQNKHSSSLNSWLEINKLTDYLQKNCYAFKYLTFANILNGCGLSEIDFLACLKDLKLTLPAADQWLLTHNTDSLGEFALYHNLLCSDGIHPSLHGHESWLEQKLIPDLLKNNLLLED